MTAEAHSATAQRDAPRSPVAVAGAHSPPRSTGAAGTPTAAPAHLPEWELSWWSLTW
jgi:hypothetical protein